MKYIIPNLNTIEINTIVLDLNGTLSIHGKIPKGAKERISKLKKLGFTIVLFSGDQRGTLESLCSKMKIDFKKASSSNEKEKLFLTYDKEKTAAIGNARIDIGTFKNAKLAIATLQSEGIHTDILKHVDILVPSINDALDLFINPDSLIATLRV